LEQSIVTDETPKISAQIITWAAGQPFNNVLLLAILFCIGWGGYYTVTTGIPKHLEQIQKGYESLTESHRDERERTQQLYDKWMNRTSIENTHGSKVASGQHD
jgi:hypothetical protein